jgi:hypothetical protein
MRRDAEERTPAADGVEAALSGLVRCGAADGLGAAKSWSGWSRKRRRREEKNGERPKPMENGKGFHQLTDRSPQIGAFIGLFGFRSITL